MTMLKGFLLLFMIFSMGNTRVIGCPNGWKNFGLRCYKYFSHSVDWMTAEKHCQNVGANLASAQNKLEHDFILSLLPHPTTTWIGGHTIKEGQWLWSDGTRFQYTNWCSGEPNKLDNSEHCVEIIFTSLHCWNDKPCSAQMSHVCEKKL